MTKPGLLLALLSLLVGAPVAPASAQIVEAVGNRALGMGGAFVAVANDSTATWWNPAGIPSGEFADLSLGWSVTDIGDGVPASRERGGWVALSMLPIGLSYYHFSASGLGPLRPIEPDPGGREDRRAAVPARSLSANQVGVSLVHTLLTGINVGTTLKYVRVTGASGDVVGPESASASELFDLASDSLEGETRNAFDLDVGVLVEFGVVRVGTVVRNVIEPDLGPATLPRQVRVGVAFEPTVAGGIPLTLAVDADARTYQTAYGDRRVVAVGGEGWTRGRRVGLRAGARFNTVGYEERAFTAGASVALRAGMYLDGYVVQGGARDEGGWGVAARVTF